jgi:predicted RNA-binding protein YlxR (DUF448 family)
MASRHEPRRTCVGCRQEAGKKGLIRIVRLPAGTVALDASGKASGRGAYVHRDPSCIDLARKRRALDRALGTPIPAELWAQVGAPA